MRDDDVRRFVERFAVVLDQAGMARMPARVFVALLISERGRMTAAELASYLGVSPAAISGAVRYLIDAGFIERDRDPGARVDCYALSGDVWSEMYLRRLVQTPIWEQAVHEGVELLPKGSPGRARLEETEAFFAFVRAELPKLMAKWQRVRSRAR